MECVRCDESDALGRAVVRDGALEAVLCEVCVEATLGHVAADGDAGATGGATGHEDAQLRSDDRGSVGGCAICTGRARVRLPLLDCLIERSDGSREWEADRSASTLGLCEVHRERVTTLDASRPAAPRPSQD